MRRLSWLRPLLAVAVCGAVLAPAPAAWAGGYVLEQGSDFDCDGLRDGVRRDANEVGGVENPGSLIVTYSRTGETDRISQASPGVPGVPEPDDHFGWAYAAYDRDQDGCDELVVGVPHEDIGSRTDAGMITIIPGSPAGLDTRNSVGYTQDSAGFPGVVEDWDRFGLSLAAGRSHRGVPFVVVGSPGESGPTSSTVGAGVIHYLRPGSVTMIHPDSPGVAGKWEAGDEFGEVLEASDRFFAVGSPSETVSGGSDGMVHVFSHSLTNGRPTPVAGFHQNTPGISGVAEWSDLFGWSLSVLPYRPSATAAVGALVAVGSPGESVGSLRWAGMVHLVYVSASGSVRELASFHQGTRGVTGMSERDDALGYDVVLANLDPDSSVATPGRTVWAAAVAFEEIGETKVGAAHILRPGWQPGDPDIWLIEGRFGLGPIHELDRLRASSSHLHVHGGFCYAVPWSNLLRGVSDPVVRLPDGCN